MEEKKALTYIIYTLEICGWLIFGGIGLTYRWNHDSLTSMQIFKEFWVESLIFFVIYIILEAVRYKYGE